MDDLILFLDAGNRASYFGYGKLWSDLSNNRNNSSLENGPIHDGINKGSFSFDGENDYVNAPINIDSNPITISLWFNIISLNYTHGVIGNLNKGFGIRNRMIIVRSGDSFEDTGVYMNSNVWYYLSLVYSLTSTELYINGNLSWTGGPSETVSSSNEMHIGKFNYSGIDKFFRGNISQVLVYNKELTSEEVQNSFNSGRERYGV